MREYRIRNWSRFQHYRERNPPWIKLHVEILSSEDWVLLSDASKLLAVVCMIVAAKRGGTVPDDPAYLRRVGYLNAEPNLKPLVECRFLELLAGASNENEPLASARPEKEAETEGEKERITSGLQPDPSKPEPKSASRKTPYPEAFEAFWREYPTDALMSKKKTFEQFKRLDQTSQEAARAAIPAFKDYCRKNATYRPVHAQRFLSERRFDGLEKAKLDPDAVAASLDKADRLLKRGKYAVGMQ